MLKRPRFWSSVLITVFIALLLPSTALTVPYDSIFKTSNTNWNCASGGSQPNYGDVFCRTDNRSYEFWIAPQGYSSSEKGQIRSVLRNEYDDTVLNPYEVSNPTFNASGTEETDLITDKAELDNFFPGANASGITWCSDKIDTVRCDQHYVFIDDDATAIVGPVGFTSIACHEIGHTVGLTHPYEAYPRQSADDTRFRCMKTTAPTNTGPGDNNKTQINATY